MNKPNLNYFCANFPRLVLVNQTQPSSKTSTTIGARGGFTIWFSDGTNTAYNTYDQDGNLSNADGVQGPWHSRRIDLRAHAGKTVSNFSVLAEGYTAPGMWYIVLADIALVSADGSARPIYNGQTSISLSPSYTAGMTEVSYEIRHLSNVGWHWPSTTMYYHGDHLGSSRTMSSVNGYPTWSGTYLPFGQEWPGPAVAGNLPSPNHYKFTGKDRDTESGLDYFGARHLSSTMGRFISPDNPKFSEKSDPQSWNLYSYVSNNPLSRIDPTGNNWFNIQGSWQWYSGANVTNDGKACKQGTKGCNHSGYTHLLVIQKTGQFNSHGAAEVKITLLGNSDPSKSKSLSQAYGFTGGPGANPVPNGNYEINLNNHGGVDTNRSLAVPGGFVLAPFHNGIQEVNTQVPAGSGVINWQDDWGAMRANLSRNGEGTPYYLHGKGLYFTEGHAFTAGCVCDPYLGVLKQIFKLDPSGVGEGNKNGRIAVTVEKAHN